MRNIDSRYKLPISKFVFPQTQIALETLEELYVFEELALLLGIKTSSKSDSLIRQIAEASVAGVCDEVAQGIEEMSLSEARGYIRARASRVVRKQTRLAIARVVNPQRYCPDTIARSATERLISTVLRKMKVGVPRILESQPEQLPMAA